jgi:hypothetical protein
MPAAYVHGCMGEQRDVWSVDCMTATNTSMEGCSGLRTRTDLCRALALVCVVTSKHAPEAGVVFHVAYV